MDSGYASNQQHGSGTYPSATLLFVLCLTPKQRTVYFVHFLLYRHLGLGALIISNFHLHSIVFIIAGDGVRLIFLHDSIFIGLDEDVRKGTRESRAGQMRSTTKEYTNRGQEPTMPGQNKKEGRKGREHETTAAHAAWTRIFLFLSGML
jgi:hypothetical protein